MRTRKELMSSMLKKEHNKCADSRGGVLLIKWTEWTIDGIQSAKQLRLVAGAGNLIEHYHPIMNALTSVSMEYLRTFTFHIVRKLSYMYARVHVRIGRLIQERIYMKTKWYINKLVYGYS